MPPPVATDDFLDLLKKSRLLTPEQYFNIVRRLGLKEIDRPEQVARRLLTEGVLTQFQADRLLQGNFRGLMLDGYRVLEVLGAGGMGWVYVAEEVQTRWRVAVKVLPEHCRHDPGVLARFRLEAEAGMRLAHPNILKTFSIHRTHDLVGEINYVVMELVRGVSLLELVILKRGRVAWQQACDVIVQTAAGLQHAHEKGLIHRDVKPENLLISSDGTVKILDFGLAMVDEKEQEFSMAMIFGQNRLGTADYVSPEQAVDSYQIDERADIYSLGCTLYFALTGRLPFPFKTAGEKLRAHRTQRPKAIEEIRTDVPERVIRICAKMMAKRLENRIPNASEVIRYLKPYAQRQNVEFDFAKILAGRVDQAEKRQEMKRRQKEEAAANASGSSLSTVTPLPNKPRQSTIETIMGEETQIDAARRSSDE